jgi:peptidoglycan/xylan/chitin deacetylase (PgdA/CDA1 family)
VLWLLGWLKIAAVKQHSGWLLAVLFSLMGGASAARGQHLLRDEHGGLIRGDVRAKKLSVVFTGDMYGESTAPILDALKQRKIPGSFFVTGNFLRRPSLRSLMKRALGEGHYVGPHSDKHLLYASWEDREKSLVSREAFRADLARNLDELRAINAFTDKRPVLFIPPYEHFNREQVAWAQEMGVTLINFTPGSGSNRDYAPEADARFVPSRKIYDDILAYEQTGPHGLNGFILLLHLGSQRKDPFHTELGALCDELMRRGYAFERVDKLLSLNL